MLIAVALILVEGVGMLLAFRVIGIGEAIDVTTSRIFLEKLIDIDGVLLGFSGIVFGVAGRWRENYRSGIAILGSVVSMFLVSIVSCFGVLALTGNVVSVPVVALELPLSFMLLAITVFFWGISTILK